MLTPSFPKEIPDSSNAVTKIEYLLFQMEGSGLPSIEWFSIKVEK